MTLHENFQHEELRARSPGVTPGPEQAGAPATSAARIGSRGPGAPAPTVRRPHALGGTSNTNSTALDENGANPRASG